MARCGLRTLDVDYMLLAGVGADEIDNLQVSKIFPL